MDIIYLTRECSKCKGMEEKRAKGEVSRIEFLSWYNIAHEPSCLLNHEGSAEVETVAFFHKSTHVLKCMISIIANVYFTCCLLTYGVLSGHATL